MKHIYFVECDTFVQRAHNLEYSSACLSWWISWKWLHKIRVKNAFV